MKCAVCGAPHRPRTPLFKFPAVLRDIGYDCVSTDRAHAQCVLLAKRRFERKQSKLGFPVRRPTLNEDLCA